METSYLIPSVFLHCVIIDLNSVQPSVTKGFKRRPNDFRRGRHTERDTNIENNVTKVFELTINIRRFLTALKKLL
jgi:hypothetical protein